MGRMGEGWGWGVGAGGGVLGVGGVWVVEGVGDGGVG